MMRTIAAVTAGQAPREDIVGEMRPFLPDVRWVQHGALDGVGDTDLPHLAPATGEFPVITRLKSGRPVVVGERALRPLLERAIVRAATEAELVLVICSAPFPLPESPVPLLLPDRLLEATVVALHSTGRLAVLTPVEAQMPMQETRWRRLGVDALVLHASPYGESDFARLGRTARELGASLAVFDCLGYTAGMRAELTAASGLSAILVRSLLARVAAELLG